MSFNGRLFLLLASCQLLFWSGLPGAVLAEPGERPTAEVLSEQLDAFLVGASRNDRATHEAFWADDLVYTSSSGARFGKAEILAGLDAPNDSDGDQPVYTASQVHVQDFGSIAVVTFRLHASLEGEAIADYFNTGVFRLGDQGWQAVTWQATRAAEAEYD